MSNDKKKLVIFYDTMTVLERFYIEEQQQMREKYERLYPNHEINEDIDGDLVVMPIDEIED